MMENEEFSVHLHMCVYSNKQEALSTPQRDRVFVSSESRKPKEETQDVKMNEVQSLMGRGVSTPEETQDVKESEVQKSS